MEDGEDDGEGDGEDDGEGAEANETEQIIKGTKHFTTLRTLCMHMQIRLQF